MLSKEAKDSIKMIRSMKESQKDSLKAELVPDIRKNTDKQMSVEVPKSLKLETINETKFSGELYHQEMKQDSVLLFIHGGGYATGTVKSRRDLCFRILSRVGFDGFSLDYSQWPEAHHPTAQNETVASYLYLLKRYKNIVVFGESAGATLALTLTLQLKRNHQKLPDKIAVFSPVITQLNIMPSEFLNNERDPMLIGAGDPVPYFKDPAAHDELVSPIYGNYKDFPPLFINCGSEEVKYDDSVVLNYLCQKANVDVTWKVWQNLYHVL